MSYDTEAKAREHICKMHGVSRLDRLITSQQEEQAEQSVRDLNELLAEAFLAGREDMREWAKMYSDSSKKLEAKIIALEADLARLKEFKEKE